MHKTACVYGTAIGLTNLLTNFAKLYVGYLRPLFYDVCVPDDAYEYCSSGEDNSARKSFPSGHSSISFCGLGLLSFYLEWRFGVSSLRSWHQDSSVVSGEIMVMTQRRPLRLERIKSIFCYAPMLLAGFIATSRIVDNKHFPSDVVGGSILGAAIAKLVHGIWYD
jgi:diacylglycerol diphosphate phosphatase/phosphatidate phosphatase